jgi:phospholipid/cholesterol/gamma-HCH transport system permease protein
MTQPSQQRPQSGGEDSQFSLKFERAVERIGDAVIGGLSSFGGALVMLVRALGALRHIIADRRLYFRQAVTLGVESLPLVLLIGTFTGAVMTWQANYTANNIMPMKYLGVATYKSVVVELGPVLSGLVLAGRVGSALAAELGTMKISEQIDALDVLAIDPIRYLVAPRLIASLVMMPILVILAVFFAMLGGFTIAYLFMGLGPQVYFGEIPVFFYLKDIQVMLVKSGTFGLLIALVGTRVGMTTGGGAEGVGLATIRSFVLSSLLILFSDLMLAMIMF